MNIKDATNKIIEQHVETFWKLRVNELEEKVKLLQVENDQLKHKGLGFDSEKDYKTRIKQLESFIESSLGIAKKPTVSSCADPVSYCNSCGCGKKEMILSREKK